MDSAPQDGLSLRNGSDLGRCHPVATSEEISVPDNRGALLSEITRWADKHTLPDILDLSLSNQIIQQLRSCRREDLPQRLRVAGT